MGGACARIAVERQSFIDRSQRRIQRQPISHRSSSRESELTPTAIVVIASWIHEQMLVEHDVEPGFTRLVPVGRLWLAPKAASAPNSPAVMRDRRECEFERPRVINRSPAPSFVYRVRCDHESRHISNSSLTRFRSMPSFESRRHSASRSSAMDRVSDEGLSRTGELSTGSEGPCCRSILRRRSRYASRGRARDESCRAWRRPQRPRCG